jgi:hypothetical protein
LERELGVEFPAFIVFTVILHSYGLGLLNTEVATRLKSRERVLIPLHVSSFLIRGYVACAHRANSLNGRDVALAVRTVISAETTRYGNVFEPELPPGESPNGRDCQRQGKARLEACSDGVAAIACRRRRRC